jgi:F-type H+-transporting ATPase subunit epsilon
MVMVSVLNGVEGSDLSKLEQAIRSQAHRTEAINKATGIAMKGMEAELLLHFMEMDRDH